MNLIRSGVPSLFLLFLAVSAFAQEDFYHPELEWKTIETAHFYVNYHDGAERTGRAVAKIAEDIFGPVTSLYNHVPDQKVSFVIWDCDDISNGAAYFYDNKIVLYAPSMDFELRGTHNWLRNVVTHEFTHIVQIQTSMKFGRRIPAFYFQWLGYEAERRPDVLYGYPNVIVSYPLSGFVVPAWFAEGVAQFNRPELRYDFWDSHRDMILRSYALDGNMLSWDQMAVFGKTSLGNESSYNAGFAFVSYIAAKYGEEALNGISRNLASLPQVSIGSAIEGAVGKSGEDLYNEWRDEMRTEYAARVAPIRKNLREGNPLTFVEDAASTGAAGAGAGETVVELRHGREVIPKLTPCCRALETGFANMYPSYSPDGTRIAYISTKTSDYFSQASLYTITFGTPNKEKLIQPGVHARVRWSPDGRKLYYSRSTRDNPHWSYQSDIYVYDLQEEKETRLTHGMRAVSPAISPDGSTIVCVVNRDGSSNLALLKVDGSGERVITAFKGGEQAYDPEWSPSGDRILFDYSIRDGRDIAWVRPDGSDLKFLITGPDDSRTGTFTRDGTRIIFSSDKSGIFNLYSYELSSGRTGQVTNVLGGAFMPTVNASGEIMYAGYTSGGYKLTHLINPEVLPEGDFHYLAAPAVQGGSPPGTPALASVSGTPDQFDWQSLRSYDDTNPPALDAKPYRRIATSLTLVPLIRIDNYNTSSSALNNIKPGIYLFSSDILDKIGFFAGAAINRRLERDLFLQFFYRSQIPLLYQLGLEPAASLELYNVTRKTSNSIALPNLTDIPINVTYDLFEFDFALSQAFLSPVSTLEARFSHSRYTSNIEDFINPATYLVEPGLSDLYLIANNLTLTFHLDAIAPSSTSDISPVGRRVTLRFGREWNKFASTDSNGVRKAHISDVGLVYDYDHINFLRAELNWKEYVPFLFNGHTLEATVHGGAILGPPVDEFFDFYGGGLVGMKGYPFYALGGNRFAEAGLAYRFPLIRNIDVRVLQIYFDKLYGSIYADVGNAWTGGGPRLRDYKTDAGAELRLESFSFYAYPTRIFFNASYGFNRFSKFIPTSNAVVTYGREWRFYFGVLFGFDLD